jgi:hypothetical protein
VGGKRLIKGVGSPKNQETPKKEKTPGKRKPLKITKIWGDKVG